MTEQTTALKLFNEKAKRLATSKFVEYSLSHKKISVEVSAKRGEEVKIARIMPDREAIEAFVLTFRFFIQNNERCSFGNLDGVYSKLPVSEEIKNQYRDARQKLNDYLDSRTDMKFEIGLKDEELTRRKLIDVFVYGGLAHANPEKKKIFDEWMGNPLLSSFLEFEFVSALFTVLQIIRFVENLNAKVIGELG